MIAAGLRGGEGVPDTVSGHPLAFVTLTAPSFGLVHTRATSPDGEPRRCRPRRDAPICPHGVRLACSCLHEEGEECLGEPLRAACFDYDRALVWNNLLGELWRRTTIYLPRKLARLTGMTQKRLKRQVRVAYVKVAKYQQRGLVHLHVVIRLDRAMPAYRADTLRPPGRRFTIDLLEDAIRAAAAAVTVPAPADVGGGYVTWGSQLDVDVQPIGVGHALEPGRCAGYLAKNATKATEQAGGVLYRVTEHAVDQLAVRPHAGSTCAARSRSTGGGRGRGGGSSGMRSTDLGSARHEHHRIERPDRSVVWRVRWRDGGRGSRARSRRFDRRADAVAFEDDLRRRRRLGDLVGFAGAQQTLNRYVTETWAKTHAVTLAPKTAKHYASLYDLHIEPYLGELKLTELTPEIINRWQADRIADGAGRVAVLHALDLLGSILQRAVARGRLSRNPVRLVRKIARPRRREVRPLAPATALLWGDVRERTLLIQRAVSLGQEKDTKRRAHRTVRLLAPLREDLLAWRLGSGRPGETALVFRGPEGRLWTKTTYDNWRGRAFDRASAAAKVEGATPYALRHSFASLLLHEGRSVVYVARQLGHDARLTLSTYVHVIDELDDAPRVPAEDAIRAERHTSCVPGVSRKTADG